MSIVTQAYKGTRDFYPEDKRLQKWMFNVIRKVVEKYGYEEYDAPVIESTEIYKLKGSDEIVNEQAYSFIDRGGRSVTLRTEMTPSVSRMVAAKRQHLAYPLRWYSIPNLWRYERPQKGRLREFWQLNVDLFGIEGIDADVEIIQLADAILKAFSAKPSMYEIRINSRVFMDFVLRDYMGLNQAQIDPIRRLIDKKTKMSAEEFVASIEAVISPAERESGAVDKLVKFLEIPTVDQLPEQLKSVESVQKISILLETLKTLGITNALYDPTLARGFDYYTDIVFEVFDTNPNNNRSMYGGGRYDGLVELFGVEKLPTVGFGMGDVTLENFLRDNDLIPMLNTETELYIILAPDTKYKDISLPLKLLREEGVAVAVDLSGRKISKQLEVAAKKNIPFSIVIGKNELDSNQYLLRDVKTGKDSSHSLERIVSIVKSKKEA